MNTRDVESKLCQFLEKPSPAQCEFLICLVKHVTWNNRWPPPWPCSFLCVRPEPDAAGERQDTPVHPPPMWQPSQSHTEESAEAAAVGGAASRQDAREHCGLGPGDPWWLRTHDYQAQYFQTRETIRKPNLNGLFNKSFPFIFIYIYNIMIYINI